MKKPVRKTSKWRDAFYHAVHDRDHGATIVTITAADALSRSLLEETPSRQQLQEALLDLAAGQVAMAPVLRFCSEVWYTLQEKGVAQAINHAKLWRNDIEAAQKQFLLKLQQQAPEVGSGKSWAFFSRSSNVMEGLGTLMRNGYVIGDAIVGISHPGGEGLKTALTLKQCRWPVTLVPDAHLADLILQGHVERLILGCDALDSTRFVNKIGSGALAALAHQVGAEVELWTTGHKMLPGHGVNWLDLGRHHARNLDPELEKVHLEQPLFGYGYLEHVTWVRTEMGLLGPAAVQDQIRDLPTLPEELLAARDRTRRIKLDGMTAFTGA